MSIHAVYLELARERMCKEGVTKGESGRERMCKERVRKGEGRGGGEVS